MESRRSGSLLYQENKCVLVVPHGSLPFPEGLDAESEDSVELGKEARDATRYICDHEVLMVR